jgi:capsular polysaccharide transport system permease protein
MGDLAPARHSYGPTPNPPDEKTQRAEPQEPDAGHRTFGASSGRSSRPARQHPQADAATRALVRPPRRAAESLFPQLLPPDDVPRPALLRQDRLALTHPGSFGAAPRRLSLRRAGRTVLALSRRLVPGFPLLSFLAVVVAPFALILWYLLTIAAPQFHSDAAFSVRSESAPSVSAGILGAISGIGGAGGTDSDILFDYIRSQSMVEAVDRRLNLRRLWAGRPGDRLFALSPASTIEDVVDHWNRMVDVRVDDGAGLITVQARAFTADDAQALARAIVDESRLLVNRLSQEARDDAIRFSAADLADAEAALRGLRARMSDFRIRHRMIDPQADVAGTAGVVGALETELADAMVARDTLATYADESDHRMIKATRRIDAIEARIDAERSKVAAGPSDAGSAEVVGEYEALATDLEFAQAAYTQALANAALARAESRRQARYLAAHVEPTHAEAALFPRTGLLSVLAAAGLMTAWMIIMVARYNLRDSR